MCFCSLAHDDSASYIKEHTLAEATELSATFMPFIVVRPKRRTDVNVPFEFARESQNSDEISALCIPTAPR